jgi:carbamate kinase
MIWSTVTHGNGPQVGLLALQATALAGILPYPLDVLGAESEGMIGYLIAQALDGELPGREIATLLTQVEVDPAEPAFASPSKPIGPIYDEHEAAQISARTGWTFVKDGEGTAAPWLRLCRAEFGRSTSSNCWCAPGSSSSAPGVAEFLFW